MESGILTPKYSFSIIRTKMGSASSVPTFSSARAKHSHNIFVPPLYTSASMLRSVYAGLFLATLAYTAQVLTLRGLSQVIACYACGGFVLECAWMLPQRIGLAGHLARHISAGRTCHIYRAAQPHPVHNTHSPARLKRFYRLCGSPS